MAMPNLELSRDLRELLKCFLSHDVRYLVIGDHAVSFHGYPRFTKDLDIWIERSETNAKAVMEALIDYGFDRESLSPEMFNQEGRMTQIGREPNRVDIIQNIKGIDFPDCFARRTHTEIDGAQIPLISLNDLLANKLATARPQDIADARELEKIIAARKTKKHS